MAFGDYNYKLEVYNQANSSKLCEFIRSDFLAGEVVQEVDGEDSLTFQIPKAHANFSHLVKFNVVRLCDTRAGTFVVYRIKSVKAWRQRQKLLAEVYCEHMKYDLAGMIINAEKQFVQENPRTILDYILSFSDGFTRGSCPGVTYAYTDFSISFESCMSAIKRLAETIGFEWEVRAGAAPDYKVVDIERVGTGESVTIQYGTNLKSISHNSQIGSDFATRLIPRGGAALIEQRRTNPMVAAYIKPGTMDVAGAAFIVKSWNSSTRWLKVTSANLLAADGALNGFYAFVWGEKVAILDSKTAADGDEIQLESSPGSIPSGELVYIYKDEDNPMDFVPNVALESTYLPTEQIFTCDDLPDILNVAGPEGYSDLSGTYTSGLCQGWTRIGSPTVSENTNADLIRTGTKSQKVVTSDGEGILRAVDCGSATAASFYIWVYIQSITDGVKLKVRLKLGLEDDYFPRNADTGEDEAYVTEMGWRQIICEGGILSGAGSHDLEILAVGGSVTFYLDSVMVQCSEYITDEDNFYAWDTRVVLWEKAVARLNEVSAPKEDINLEIIDLYEADRDTYYPQQITPGTDLEIVDTAMGFDVTEVRTRRKTWNLIRPWECKLEVEG